MGAQMAIAVTRDPHLAPEAAHWCNAHRLPIDVRNDLTHRVILNRIEQLSLTQEDADEWDHLTEEKATPETLRSALTTGAVAITEDRRDVTELIVNDLWWLATGGFSYGEPPTDAYNWLTILDAFRITEPPVTTDELIAASRQLAEANQ